MLYVILGFLENKKILHHYYSFGTTCSLNAIEKR